MGCGLVGGGVVEGGRVAGDRQHVIGPAFDLQCIALPVWHLFDLQARVAGGEELVLLKVKLETIGEDFFRSLGLRQTPTLSLFCEGTEIARLPGFQSPGQITQAVRAHFDQVPA